MRKRQIAALVQGLLERNRLWAEAWIGQTIKGDAALGRSGANFSQDPAAQVKRHVRALNSRGILVYAGSGNYFQVDVTGQEPRLIHRRPLAQRYVKLTTGEH